MKHFGTLVDAVLATIALLSLGLPVAAQAQGASKDLVAFKATTTIRIDGFVIPMDPPVVSARLTGTGQSDLLGAFTMLGHALVSLGVDEGPLFPSDEIHVFTAANGDAVFVTIGGFPSPTGTPGIVTPHGHWKIVGGKGRFVGAVGSGAFTGTADFTKSEETLTLEGMISRPK
jgi:hypothetical protein